MSTTAPEDPEIGAGPAAGDTAARLRRSAEQLFAARGVDAVSVRQITLDAGQRNTTAVAYHFGSRDGLLHAVLQAHLAHVRIRHRALLERYEAGITGAEVGDAGATSSGAELLDLVDVLVMPLCAELDCAHGGPEFLRIAAEVLGRGDWELTRGGPADALIADFGRWSALVEPYLPAGGVGRPLHRRFAAMRFCYAELGRRAGRPTPRRNDRLFASQLTDLVAALLSAPIGERTARLLG